MKAPIIGERAHTVGRQALTIPAVRINLTYAENTNSGMRLAFFEGNQEILVPRGAFILGYEDVAMLAELLTKQLRKWETQKQ